MFPRNLYRLLAVVVHSGVAQSGHFVTYRRGALRNSHKYFLIHPLFVFYFKFCVLPISRWYYTSDTIVKEVTIDEVLSKPAYILFYDRGPQKSMA